MSENFQRKCLNCETVLTDSFCAACGQKDIDPQVGFRTMMSDFISGFFAFDARVYRSLRLLILNPGALTADYLKGRRQRFVPPFKLYLFATFLAFLMLNLVDARLLRVQSGNQPVRSNSLNSPQEEAAPASNSTSGEQQQGGTAEPSHEAGLDPATATTEAQATQDGTSAEEAGYFKRRFFERMHLVSQDEKRANRILVQLIPKSMFVILPFFALILRLFYWKYRLRYPQWLIFALYFHAFTFFLITLGAGFIAIDQLKIFRILITIWVPVYLFLALRRITTQSILKTLLKLAGFLLIYSMSLLLTLGILGVLTIWTFQP